MTYSGGSIPAAALSASRIQVESESLRVRFQAARNVASSSAVTRTINFFARTSSGSLVHAGAFRFDLAISADGMPVVQELAVGGPGAGIERAAKDAGLARENWTAPVRVLKLLDTYADRSYNRIRSEVSDANVEDADGNTSSPGIALREWAFDSPSLLPPVAPGFPSVRVPLADGSR